MSVGNHFVTHGKLEPRLRDQPKEMNAYWLPAIIHGFLRKSVAPQRFVFWGDKGAPAKICKEKRRSPPKEKWTPYVRARSCSLKFMPWSAPWEMGGGLPHHAWKSEPILEQDMLELKLYGPWMKWSCRISHTIHILTEDGIFFWWKVCNL